MYGRSVLFNPLNVLVGVGNEGYNMHLSLHAGWWGVWVLCVGWGSDSIPFP